MATPTEICNMALSHLGISKEIADYETEKSQEAAACRRFYLPCLKQSQRDFSWSFCTVFDDLALVSSNPTDEWDYSYRYPVDCERFVRILSGIRNDAPDTEVPYRIASDDAGQLIYTDKASAEIEYQILRTDAERFPSDYVMALSLLLAFYIAPRLTNGDPFKMGQRAYEAYKVIGKQARATNNNEQSEDVENESMSVRSRY